MSSPLFHVGAQALCPHGAPVTTVSSNARVLVSGQPVATLADVYPIASCPFFVGSKAQPCVMVQWLTPAVRVTVNGAPAILQTSSGICKSGEQIPQGPPMVVASQPRVTGM